MANKSCKFKAGDSITACPNVMKDDSKASQLMSRTGLSKEELKSKMRVVVVHPKGQISIRHNGLKKPFVAHQKFFASEGAAAN